MKKIITFLLCILLCISLTSCKADPIELVQNGELNYYPGETLAETFRTAFDDAEIEYKETWDDLTDDMKDVLEEMDGKPAFVRCHYELLNAKDLEDIIITYLADLSDESFVIFSISMDGEIFTDEDDIEEILEYILG